MNDAFDNAHADRAILAKLTPSFLLGPVLYCSKRCAIVHKGTRAANQGHELTPGEFSQEAFGALCPMCGHEYGEF